MVLKRIASARCHCSSSAVSATGNDEDVVVDDDDDDDDDDEEEEEEEEDWVGDGGIVVVWVSGRGGVSEDCTRTNFPLPQRAHSRGEFDTDEEPLLLRKEQKLHVQGSSALDVVACARGGGGVPTPTPPRPLLLLPAATTLPTTPPRPLPRAPSGARGSSATTPFPPPLPTPRRAMGGGDGGSARGGDARGALGAGLGAAAAAADDDDEDDRRGAAVTSQRRRAMASRCCFRTSAELRPKMGSFMDLPVVHGRLLCSLSSTTPLMLRRNFLSDLL